MDKLKLFIGMWMKNVQGNLMKKTRPIKWLVFSYFIMVAMLVLTYYAAWIWLWYGGKVVMGDLLAIIKEMVGASMVAFVTFIATCFVDKDGDGIPDRFEKEEGKNENRNQCGTLSGTRQRGGREQDNRSGSD